MIRLLAYKFNVFLMQIELGWLVDLVRILDRFIKVVPASGHEKFLSEL